MAPYLGLWGPRLALGPHPAVSSSPLWGWRHLLPTLLPSQAPHPSGCSHLAAPLPMSSGKAGFPEGPAGFHCKLGYHCLLSPRHNCKVFVVLSCLLFTNNLSKYLLLRNENKACTLEMEIKQKFFWFQMSSTAGLAPVSETHKRNTGSA